MLIDFVGKKKVRNVCTVKNKKVVRSLKEKILHSKLESLNFGKFGELFSKLFIRDKYKRPSISDVLNVPIIKQQIEENNINTHLNNMNPFLKYKYITARSLFCAL